MRLIIQSITNLLIKHAALASVLFSLSFTVSAENVFIGAQDSFNSVFESSDGGQSNNVQLSSKESSQALSIRKQVLLYIESDKNEDDIIKQVLQYIEDNGATLNIAERYMLALIVAKKEYELGNYTKVIDILAPIRELENDIPEAQRNSSRFNHFDLILANSYAQKGEFDSAYAVKKAYIKKKFSDYNLNHKKTLLLHEEKYDIERKKTANELLEKQSKINQLELQDTARKQKEKERDLVILVCVCIVFVLMIIRQFKIRSKLKWLARTDGLTRLLNRGSLFIEGEELFTAAIHNGQELSVILLDIDFFKAINDQFGHDVGDAALIQVAKLGKEVVRSRDILARLGGEEFVAVLPEATQEEAKAIAERYKDKIAQSNILMNKYGCQITASIGVASIKQVSSGFDALLNAADEAMYLAKENGRNTVTTFQVQGENIAVNE